MTKAFIFFMIMSTSFADIVNDTFDVANSYYSKGNYENSIEIYEKIIFDGLHSSNLYYNLGNAYYRQGMLGQSIWAYNKAISLKPRLNDANYNLDIAMASMKDRITLPAEFPPVQLYINIKSSYTFNEWLFFGSLLTLFTVCFFVASKVFILSNQILRKITSMFILTIVLFHLILIDLFFDNNGQALGIIISNEVNAYSGPFRGESTMLFTVNEGTRAEIYQRQGDWVEIGIVDGDKAWIPFKNIRQL